MQFAHRKLQGREAANWLTDLHHPHGAKTRSLWAKRNSHGVFGVPGDTCARRKFATNENHAIQQRAKCNFRQHRNLLWNRPSYSQPDEPIKLFSLCFPTVDTMQRWDTGPGYAADISLNNARWAPTTPNKRRRVSRFDQAAGMKSTWLTFARSIDSFLQMRPN